MALFSLEELKKFHRHFTVNVTFIRLETSNQRSALKIFETINDRGVGLTPIDLLKNYLFMEVQSQNGVNTDWKNLARDKVFPK